MNQKNAEWKFANIIRNELLVLKITVALLIIFRLTLLILDIQNKSDDTEHNQQIKNLSLKIDSVNKVFGTKLSIDSLYTNLNNQNKKIGISNLQNELLNILNNNSQKLKTKRQTLERLENLLSGFLILIYPLRWLFLLILKSTKNN
jgi:hypothetical protein